MPRWSAPDGRPRGRCAYDVAPRGAARRRSTLCRTMSGRTAPAGWGPAAAHDPWRPGRGMVQARPASGASVRYLASTARWVSRPWSSLQTLMPRWLRSSVPDTGASRGAGEHAAQSVIAQRFVASLSSPANQEHVAGGGVGRPLMHHVVADCRQGASLQQVDGPVPARFLPHSDGMVVAVTDHDATSSVGDVLQPHSEHLARAQAAFPHQLHQRAVASSPQDREQGAVRLGGHRPGQRLDCLDAQGPADWPLWTRRHQRRPGSARNPRGGVVGDGHQRVVRAPVALDGDQELEERGHRRQHPVACLGRQQPPATRGQGQVQLLRPAPRRASTQPLDELDRPRRSELLHHPTPVGQELVQLLEIVRVGPHRVRE
jgi:hypothetical protein